MKKLIPTAAGGLPPEAWLTILSRRLILSMALITLLSGAVLHAQTYVKLSALPSSSPDSVTMLSVQDLSGTTYVNRKLYLKDLASYLGVNNNIAAFFLNPGDFIVSGGDSISINWNSANSGISSLTSGMIDSALGYIPVSPSDTTAMLSYLQSLINAGTTALLVNINSKLNGYLTALPSLSGDVTSSGNNVYLNPTGVTAGTYTNPSVKVNPEGRIDSISNGSPGGVASFNGRTGAVIPGVGDYTASMVGLGSVTNNLQLNASALSNDSSFSANSPSLVPTQHAVRTYVLSTMASGTAGVSSFNGRTGAVNPAFGDYTPSMVGLGNVTNRSTANDSLNALNAAAADTSALLNYLLELLNGRQAAGVYIIPSDTAAMLVYMQALINADTTALLNYINAKLNGLSSAGVSSVTAVSPLVSSGGTSPSISLSASGVAPGSYTNSNITVNSQGLITSASNGSGSGSSEVYWNTVSGTPTRANNYSFTITDNSGVNNYSSLYDRGTVLKWTDSGTKMAMINSSIYASNTVTITVMGDSISSTATMSSMMYAIDKAISIPFSRNGAMTLGIDIAGHFYADKTYKVFGIDCYHGSPGTSGSTIYNVVVQPTNPLWIAVGAGINTIAYSQDGISWTGLGTSIFSIQGNAVAYNGSMWIAVGQGSNTIAYSTNGTNWTAVSGSTSIFSTSGLCIAWNGNVWIAGGSGTNTMAYSTNGINWTAISGSASIFTSACRGIAWNGNMWVAVGNGTNSIAYSSVNTGTSGWTVVTNSTSIFSTQGNGVAWNGSIWLAAGYGSNSIAYSINGTSWTGEGNFTNEAYQIGWNGNLWVLAGYYSEGIAYSSNGITWTNTNTNLFNYSTYCVATNGFLWLTGGVIQNNNSIAYSTNGSTWTGETTNTLFSSAVFGIACSIEPAYFPPIGQSSLLPSPLCIASDTFNVQGEAANSGTILNFGNIVLINCTAVSSVAPYNFYGYLFVFPYNNIYK